MGWILRLVEVETDKPGRDMDVMEIRRSSNITSIAELGLSLAEAKELLARVQQAVVAAQAWNHSATRRNCTACGTVCYIKDWRPRQIASLFGAVTVMLPRLRCGRCGLRTTSVSWPRHCRSTPELDAVRAHLSALMPYRVAAGVLTHLLPVYGGHSPETFRAHTFRVGTTLRATTAADPPAKANGITITADSTYIRSCEGSERHLEVRVGNVETDEGARLVFGAVARSDTDIVDVIRRSLDDVGRTAETEVTAFTDGCLGLQSILSDAGVARRPIADWFHIAMRLQHAKSAASALSIDNPRRRAAKERIVEEVERLHWRIWNGKTKDAELSIERTRKVMRAFRGERARRMKAIASRKLWHALHEIDTYLRGQSARLVNYAARHRAGLRVGTSVTEGTANFLVNRRMNKSQGMRWSREGADLLLQVRCAAYNGAFGSAFSDGPTSGASAESALAQAA
jgi:hypothetical protein